jgi:hypothetical protein
MMPGIGYSFGAIGAIKEIKIPWKKRLAGIGLPSL